ncbi:hypothetical protein C9J51_12820 [Photobacterium iliopiscarium]|nr:hypothetical protein UB38_18430 [Photobacterium iliopiscarium]PST95667.1 hypothetical protein C9I87_08410 [Photobacterium iliopiscarium]PSU00885.1 hypothetical protein C9I85_05250 [Photobacterium iliopiscarium]PSV82092.1 hypothetical protein C9J51_12820 [Photobacterium iliopiscarium]
MIPKRCIIPSIAGSVVGYWLARQCDDFHSLLLGKFNFLLDKTVLFMCLVPIIALLVIIENKYIWGKFIKLETNADVWGVSFGFLIGFVTLGIY